MRRFIPDPVIAAIALGNVAIRLLVFDNLGFHRDELLYFSLGNHPAFGYASVPPLIGWISWLLQLFFGPSLFAVRLFPALLSGVMIFLVASLAREMGGSRYSAILSAVGLTVSIFFMRSFCLFHPVHIEIFLWTLCLWLIVRYLNSRSDSYLLWFGVAAGFTLLNKYLAGLLFSGLILTVLFSQHRHILTGKPFWKAMAAGAVVFLPNLIWQAVHLFPVFRHMSELYDTQLVHMNPTVFLTEQLLNPFTGSLLAIAGLLTLTLSEKMRTYRFLGYTSLFVIIALLLLKGKSYYTLGVFPFIMAAGAVAIETAVRQRAIRIALPLLMILLTLPGLPIGIPVYGAEGLKEYFRILDEDYHIDLGRRFEDGSIHTLPQDYADMLGWDELAALADSAWRKIEDKNAAFIYCENYGQAGSVSVIGKKYGLPEAVSFNESFMYWFPRKFSREITSLVYINYDLGEDVKNLFGKIDFIGAISDPDAREYGTSVYLCSDPVVSFNSFWEERTKDIR